MQLIDENAISRGMVRVDAGEDLVESLQALAHAAGWTEAMVTGAGSLELVELMTVTGTTLTIENAELLSLAGRISRAPDGSRLVALRAAIATDTGIKAGRITAAMTGGLLLVIDAVADRARSTPPPRVARPTTDRAPAHPAQTAQPARPAAQSTNASPAFRSPNVPTTPRAPGFGDGQRSASKPLSQSFKTKPVMRPVKPQLDFDDDDDDDNPIVNIGDHLHHPQLGLCEVVGEDDSGGLKIRVQSGKSRVLRLDALLVLPGEKDEEGRLVFRIVGPRRRER